MTPYNLVILAVALKLSTGQTVFNGFPGFFGNRVCVTQQGRDAPTGTSTFLHTCKDLKALRSCYQDTVLSGSTTIEFIKRVFNLDKFESGYAAMCTQLEDYVKNNNDGLANLLQLEQSTIRKAAYLEVAKSAAVMAQDNNTKEYNETVCQKSKQFTLKAENLLTADKFSKLKKIMIDTFYSLLTSECHSILFPRPVFDVYPSISGITVKDIAERCIKNSSEAWLYLYDSKSTCGNSTFFYWPHHLSCRYAEEFLECTNKYLEGNSDKFDHWTLLIQKLFDLDRQKKGFRSYCTGNSREYMSQLQCLPKKLLEEQKKKCDALWRSRVSKLLGSSLVKTFREQLCTQMYQRIDCTEQLLGKQHKIFEFYAQLQKSSLPAFCDRQQPTHQPVLATTSFKPSGGVTGSKVDWLLFAFAVLYLIL